MLLGVLLVALVLLAADADLAVAEIVLMLAVVGASVLGYAVGLVAAFEAFALLSYLFAPPRESFSIEETDDLVALGAFVAVSVVVGAIVARLNELRARASLAAREAELRDARHQRVARRVRTRAAVADATCRRARRPLRSGVVWVRRRRRPAVRNGPSGTAVRCSRTSAPPSMRSTSASAPRSTARDSTPRLASTASRPRSTARARASSRR